MFTVAVGPVVAAIGIGVLVAYGLEKLDQQFGLTQRVVAALDELEAGVRTEVDQAKYELARTAGDVAGTAIDYAISVAQKIVVDTAKHYLQRTVPRW